MTHASGAGRSPSGPGCSGLGVAIGPVTGGLLLEHFSWSSVFWINVPIAVVALALGVFLVPDVEGPQPAAPSTRSARCCRSSGSAACCSASSRGRRKGWTDPLVLVGFAVGAVASVWFVLWELHTPSPMLDMRFFKNPRFTAANSAITLTFFAMFGSMFLMTQYWQFVHGYSPLAGRRADAAVRPDDDGRRPAVGAPRRAPRDEAHRHGRPVDRGGRADVDVVPDGNFAVRGRHRHVLRHGDGHGPDDGPGDGVRDGRPAAGEGRRRVGRQRHDAADGRRPRRGDHRQPRVERVRGAGARPRTDVRADGSGARRRHGVARRCAAGRPEPRRAAGGVRRRRRGQLRRRVHQRPAPRRARRRRGGHRGVPLPAGASPARSPSDRSELAVAGD